MLLSSQYSNLANRINAKTTGSIVNIINYSSSSNAYTLPSDGYVAITCDSSTGTNVKVFIVGSFSFGCSGSGQSYGRNALFLKKGMKVYVEYEGSGFHTASFIPIS